MFSIYCKIKTPNIYGQNQRDVTNVMNISRPIYASWASNRYFHNACILWGFKTPAMCFMFLQERRRWRAWQSGSGQFKLGARFFLFPAYNAFVSFNISFLFHLQTRLSDAVVEDVACNLWDLGSIPRSPHISLSFFLKCLCAASHQVSIIHLIQESAMCPWMQIQGPRKQKHHAQESTTLHSVQKVKRAEGSNGPRFNNAPSFLAQYPLPLVYSFPFIFYFPI